MEQMLIYQSTLLKTMLDMKNLKECNCEGNGDAMKKVKEKKEENKVNFDLSTLTLEELVEVYENIKIFIDYLEESKIEIEEKGKENE